MPRKRLLLDVDEVLANFHDPVFEVIEKTVGKKLTAHDFDTWDIFGVFPQKEREEIFREVGAPGFCASFQPKDGAIEAIREIRTMVDVTPVTRPFPSPTWAYERILWLGQHFGFTEPEIITTGAKHLVHGDGLLDDSPHNIEDWLATHPGGLGMLWHNPNTRNMTQYDHLRVRSWSEVIEKVRAL